MDFKSVLSILLKEFDKNNIDYALMGGFALGIWGVGSTTVDIDFLVSRDHMMKTDRIMLEAGYECKYRSENVSQYVSSLRVFGEVDFLHAFREASLEMLKRAVQKEIFGGSLKIKVLQPEDIIGLKVQAIKNNPRRAERDIMDIKSLISVWGKELDWSLVEGYFRIFNMEKLYERIIKK